MLRRDGISVRKALLPSITMISLQKIGKSSVSVGATAVPEGIVNIERKEVEKTNDVKALLL